jgi:hypothetical protein
MDRKEYLKESELRRDLAQCNVNLIKYQVELERKIELLKKELIKYTIIPESFWIDEDFE